MSFANKNLSVIAYANGFTLWHYAENDKLSDACTDGFFDGARTLMNAGDILLVSGRGGAAIRAVAATHPRVALAPLC